MEGRRRPPSRTTPGVATMSSPLTWSALLLAALAAVACWGGEPPEACVASRPPFGEDACCERHLAATQAAVSARRLGLTYPPAPPIEASMPRKLTRAEASEMRRERIREL